MLALLLSGAMHWDVLRSATTSRDCPAAALSSSAGPCRRRTWYYVLPSLAAKGINVKIVAAVSPQLFARQPLDYRQSVATPGDRLDAMIITNGGSS